MRIKEVLIQNLVTVFIVLITILFLGIFIFQFYESPLSENIAAWGSFGDYIGGVILSLISIFLLYKTYKEQQYTNVITRFESRFWNLKNKIELTKEELDEVNAIARMISDHFIRGNNEKKITNGEFVALLGYYWILHTRGKETFYFQYFEKMQNLLSIVLNSSTIRKQDKEANMSILFVDKTDEETLCLLSYLAFCSYRKSDYSLFSYDAMLNLIVRCDSLCRNVCKRSDDKISNIKLYIEDDYGYNDCKWKKESYIQTLDRVINNKS